MEIVSTATDNTPIALIDEVIGRFFDEAIEQSVQVDSSYTQLWEHIRELMHSGGKRLRPRMTIMAYEAFGGTHTDAIAPVAAAQEFLHFSLLIHDDIIDRDYTRYGVLNIAGRYKQTYEPWLAHREDQLHFAHSAALLAGDLMLSGAYQLIANSTLNHQDKQISQQLLSRGLFEVAGGELLDTELSFMPYSPGDAINVARYKTAGYSFIAPLVTGARLAGVTQAQVAAVECFGAALGIAYQLVDDLLGVFGESEATGKSTDSDIVEGKRTYLVEQAFTRMSEHDTKKFQTLFGKSDATADEIAEVKSLLISCGARHATEQAIYDYVQDARGALLQFGVSEYHQEVFEAFIKKVTERDF